MKTINFKIQKGGVGATSIGVSVAFELAKNYKVLLVDGDPQGNASSWILSNCQKELADLLLSGEEGFPDETFESCVTHTNNKNLDVLATFGIGGKLSVFRNGYSSKKPFKLKKILKSVSSIYDFCIIDSSPSNSDLERTIYIASDEVIPVLQLNQFSVEGLEIFINTINEIKSDMDCENPVIKALILNSKDLRIGYQNSTLELFESNNSKFKLFVIPVDQGFNKAQQNNISIHEVEGVKKDTLEALKNIAGFIAEDLRG